MERKGSRARADRASRYATLLRIMAHPIRLMILEELARGMKCVNDMREILGVPQPNVSQHLALLKRRGLIVSYKKGSSRCYHLAQSALVRDLMAWLSRSHAALDFHEAERFGTGRNRGLAQKSRRGGASGRGVLLAQRSNRRTLSMDFHR
jgi:ArsR family transcriptional regulator